MTIFHPPSLPKSPQAELLLLELLYDGIAEVCFVTKLCALFWSRISKPVTARTLVALVTAFLQPLDDVLFFDGCEVYHRLFGVERSLHQLGVNLPNLFGS